MLRSAIAGAAALLASWHAHGEASRPGEALFNQQCRACHQVGENARNGLGPHLNGLFSRAAGSVSGFGYSEAFRRPPVGGRPWTAESFAAFLRNPREAVPGTRMVYRGLQDEALLAQLADYLRSVGPARERAR
jgi:cytochrome c